MEYPNYSSSGYNGLESYLRRAQTVPVHPIFPKILRLGDDLLSIEDKNTFIDMYCAAVPDFMSLMNRSYDSTYPDPPPNREVTYVSADEHDPKFYEHPYGANGEKRPKSTIVVRDGGKSRRRSNRKSRRR